MSRSTPKKGFVQLLSQDPSPTLIVDALGNVLCANPAMQSLRPKTSEGYGEVLPVNTVALIKSALEQNRAIEKVESRIGSLILLWSFIDFPLLF